MFNAPFIMKKNCYHPFLAMLVSAFGIAGAAMMTSCTNEDAIAPGNGGGNSFTYCDTEHNIGSVVYTVDENKVYTVYFSPTPGLATLSAIQMADDYIKVVTKTPTGEIDLLSSGNSLVYENVNVSAETAGNVSRSTLSLKLTSVSTVMMNLDVAMSGGETLTGRYEGLCVNVSESGNDSGIITLDRQVFFYYYGQVQDDERNTVNNYYLALSDIEEWSGSGISSAPASEGYILTLDFYGEQTDDWRNFPEGTFDEDDSHKAGTYYSASQYSFVSYRAADGTVTDLQLTGEPVSIEYDGVSGTYTVTANFIDMNDNDRTFVYTGRLNISDGTVQSNLPLIGDDVAFDGVPDKDNDGNPDIDGMTGTPGDAIFFGDVYDMGAGLMAIEIYDLNASNNRDGYQMSIMLMTYTSFPDDGLYIESLEYTVSSSLTFGTALTGVEGVLMGGIVPWGTYAAKIENGEEVAYSFASEGTVEVSTVTRPGGQEYYRIEFDLMSTDGHTIKGEYVGDIIIQDVSDSDDGNDGSTNLTKNVETDLSYLPYASCLPKTEIYAGGLGTIPVESVYTGKLPDGTSFEQVGQPCSYQVLNIGLPTGYFEFDPKYPETGLLHEGDFISLDLLVEPGTETKITPGTYNLTSNRYPAQMKPGVCVRGFTGVAGNDGTRYQHLVNIIGNGYPYGLDDQFKTWLDNGNPDPDNEYFQENGPLNRATFDLFACIYGGSVTISEPDSDGDYTITIDGTDVLNHTIKGSWTGPIWLNGNSETPVQPNTGTAASSVMLKKARSMSLETVPSLNDISWPAKRWSLE